MLMIDDDLRLMMMMMLLLLMMMMMVNQSPKPFLMNKPLKNCSYLGVVGKIEEHHWLASSYIDRSVGCFFLAKKIGQKNMIHSGLI